MVLRHHLAQLLERAGFDLADAIAAERQLLADLAQRVGALAVEAEAHTQHQLLARVEHLQDAPRVFGALPSLPSHVRAIGYVSDAQLRALYESAACFVYPSFYEGFGLPPLEAMCCGCPVLASGTASMPEVCADAALYCDPNSPEDIAAKLQQLMSDRTVRDDLRAKGRRRAAEFSWERLNYVDALKEAAGAMA